MSMTFLRHVVVGLFLVVLGVLTTPIAHADPHAVFYTAIGQQQLFFNVLAALDQADYVEPATGPFSREQLKELRNQAIINEARKVGVEIPSFEEDPVVSETSTELSNILTRPVTLEGSDLFTSYLAREHTIEVSRRAGTALLLNTIFCQLGLGREGCNNSAQDLSKRDKAFITDPIKWASFPFTHGVVPALLSGLSIFDELRQQAIDDGADHFIPGLFGDENIHELNERTQATNPGARRLLDDSLASALISFLPGELPADLYADLPIDENGDVRLAYNTTSAGNVAFAQTAPQPGDPTFNDWYNNKLLDLMAEDLILRQRAQIGADKVIATQEVSESQGEVASLQNVPRSDVPSECANGTCPPPLADGSGGSGSGSSTSLSLEPAIEVPVNAKVGQVTAGIQALSDLNTNLRSASPNNLQDPTGTVKLLRNLPDSDSGGSGGVQGSTSDQLTEPTQTGEVLGINQGQDSGGIVLQRSFGAAPPVGVHQILPQGEDDLGNFLLAVIGEGTGCNCKIDDVGNHFGDAFLQRINELPPATP